jgi:single-stranded DNA-binding protein
LTAEKKPSRTDQISVNPDRVFGGSPCATEPLNTSFFLTCPYPEQITEWHRITCFNGLAATIAKHVEKGKKLTVVGHLHYSEYEKDGQTRHSCEVIADQIEFG